MSYFTLKKHDNFIASLWMILASLSLSLNAALTKLLTQKYPASKIFFLKAILMVILLFPKFLLDRKNNKLKLVLDKKLYFLKAFLVAISFSLWYKALKYISITEAISITYLTPSLNILAGFFFFGEKFSNRKLLAIIIAFCGALIIVRPGFKEENIWLYIVILISILWSIIDIISKVQVKNESIANLIFYNAILTCLFIAPISYFQELIILNQREIFILIGAVLLNIINLYSFYKAYKLGELTVIVPVDFMKIIFSIIISYYLFHKKFELFDLYGAILLFISSIILICGRANDKVA